MRLRKLSMRWSRSRWRISCTLAMGSPRCDGSRLGAASAGWTKGVLGASVTEPAMSLRAKACLMAITHSDREKEMGVEQEAHQACSNSSAISGLAASIDSGTVNSRL
jgi:hypothetical protein